MDARNRDVSDVALVANAATARKKVLGVIVIFIASLLTLGVIPLVYATTCAAQLRCLVNIVDRHKTHEGARAEILATFKNPNFFVKTAIETILERGRLDAEREIFNVMGRTIDDVIKTVGGLEFVELDASKSCGKRQIRSAGQLIVANLDEEDYRPGDGFAFGHGTAPDHLVKREANGSYSWELNVANVRKYLVPTSLCRDLHGAFNAHSTYDFAVKKNDIEGKLAACIESHKCCTIEGAHMRLCNGINNAIRNAYFLIVALTVARQYDRCAVSQILHPGESLTKFKCVSFGLENFTDYVAAHRGLIAAIESKVVEFQKNPTRPLNGSRYCLQNCHFAAMAKGIELPEMSALSDGWAERNGLNHSL
ncbi:MAG: hypothetical protein LBI39_04105 [Puniceicoccales bacterium]|nr:hypothetical protein [Puniceicoccales bacterium]